MCDLNIETTNFKSKKFRNKAETRFSSKANCMQNIILKSQQNKSQILFTILLHNNIGLKGMRGLS